MAVLYRREDMRVSAELPEDSLDQLSEGDSVHIELSADESREYTGTVTMISGVASQSTGEVTYRVLIDFTPDDAVRYGMSVVVETLEAETAEEEEEPEEEREDEAETAENADAAANSESPESFAGEFPEGFPGDGWPGEGRPEGGARQHPDGN